MGKRALQRLRANLPADPPMLLPSAAHQGRFLPFEPFEHSKAKQQEQDDQGGDPEEEEEE
ncbi:MAG: hypothetical protein FRX49_07348 [Trebouxia sp. A1-2]|nr:MAG: hypothetical protein FRX49_07348 [Trebouxia sp. A1-2]